MDTNAARVKRLRRTLAPLAHVGTRNQDGNGNKDERLPPHDWLIEQARNRGYPQENCTDKNCHGMSHAQNCHDKQRAQQSAGGASPT